MKHYRYDPNYDLLKKPASHYSQGTNNTRYQDHNNYPSSPNQEATYTRSPQSPPVQQQPQYQTKRPYDTHNLSLPLTNTITERLENNQYSSTTYRSNPQSPYFENRNRNQQQQQQQIPQELKVNKDQLYDHRTQRNPFLQDIQQKDSPAKDDELQNKTPLSEQSRQSLSYSEAYTETRSEPTANASSSAYNKDVYGELNRPSRSGSTVNERLIERRTPDAYGRASVATYNKEKIEDYEDVYANENEYGKTYVKSPKQLQARDNVSISSHKQAQDQTSSHVSRFFSL